MTQEFLRPEDTVSVGDWRTESGGEDLHNSLLETSPVDGDYIQSGPNPSNDAFEVALSNPAGTVQVPAGGVWTVFANEADAYTISFDDGTGWASVDAGSFHDINDNIALTVARIPADSGGLLASQAYVGFDTAAVSGTTHTANLNLFGVRTDGSLGSGLFGDQDVEILAHDWGASVDDGDWVASSQFAGKTTGSSLAFTTSSVNGVYYEFPSTEGMISAIGNGGGVTNLLLVDPNQGVEPTFGTDENDCGFSAANQAGTTRDPYLYIDSRANPITIRYRYKKNNGNETINLRIRLIEEGGSPNSVIATWDHADISTSLVTAEQTLTEAQAAAVTDWNDLRIVGIANP